MKTYTYLQSFGTLTFALLLSAFLCSSCSSSRQTTGMEGKDYSKYTALVDILRQQGGLQINENGNDVRVLVRGLNTIQLEAQPLYVVNSTPMGHNYQRVNSALNVNEITSVRVLKSLAETNQYGEPGRNGVILIKTKTGQH